MISFRIVSGLDEQDAEKKTSVNTGDQK